MLGKVLQKSRGDLYDALLAVSTKRSYDLSSNYREQSSLPKAAANPYKKRPMKLVYDKNEYHSFRLPSENHFLLGAFD